MVHGQEEAEGHGRVVAALTVAEQEVLVRDVHGNRSLQNLKRGHINTYLRDVIFAEMT